jgi:integrase/recombinase XerD
MLSPYRRHRENCKHKSRRYKSCSCPIWVQGVLNDVVIRRSLDLTSWEAANRKIREMEITGDTDVVSVKDACGRWIDDRASSVKPASLKKYREIEKELVERFGNMPVHRVPVDDVSKMKEDWISVRKYSKLTAAKRLELVRAFFSFCNEREWTDRNPAKSVKIKMPKQVPTLPFSDAEIEKLTWAIDTMRDIHPQIPESTERKYRAKFLLMLHSGIRISDAVVMQRDRIKKGKLLYTSVKTTTPVWCPLPKNVLDALA